MATVIDLKLDPETGEPVVENGDLALIYDGDVVAQMLRLKLRTFFGEWFLNTEAGIKYLEVVFVKGVQRSLVEAVFRNAILETDHVNSIKTFTAGFEPITRVFSLTFVVDTDFGELDLEMAA